MFLILAAILMVAVISGYLFHVGDEGYHGRHTFAAVAGIFGMIIAGVSAIVFAFAGWDWLAAEYKTQIINREYATNYTQAEVFYASDVIETVRQLDRKRYEINGDLVRGQEEE